ncbi:YHS domain-containing (seleno)protein, partial [Gloeocapsa sp. PCC 73106]|uniref:YHS domain-containing (seleno)protein n=1 Tax=Gloeocapsa sp. PCC 73106 TaxID=102232 RepID=UPI0002AC8739
PCAGANPCAGAKTIGIPKVYSDPQAGDKLAIRGFDTVAYFTESKPVEGKAEYEYSWNGATWRFASADNLNKFKANPEAYAPQYGGYCAKAMSEGNLASIVPEAWTIVDGKLYLNYSLEVQQQWGQDVAGNIVKGDKNWPGILTSINVVYYDTVGAVNY